MRQLGGKRAGEMRITRFLRNDRVSVAEMVGSAAVRTAGRVAGRHVLAIQDTTSVRERPAERRSVMLHPTIAVDGATGALLGLVHAELLARAGGLKQTRKSRDFADKESRRWLDGTRAAAQLRAAGALSVTVVADRESDIYEELALRPAGVELVIRAAQDRKLADATRLFASLAGLPEAGRSSIDLPAAPGRAARKATLALRFREVALACPKSRSATAAAQLPATLHLTLVEAVELDPPHGAPPAHWRLLTTHAVADLAAAERIVDIYRQRWTIEQLFRVLKTKGFDIEASRLVEGAPFEKLVTAALIAAVTVQQLVRERDGRAKRPLAVAPEGRGRGPSRSDGKVRALRSRRASPRRTGGRRARR